MTGTFREQAGDNLEENFLLITHGEINQNHINSTQKAREVTRLCVWNALHIGNIKRISRFDKIWSK